MSLKGMGVCKMAQQVKILPATVGDLYLILVSHIEEK